MIWINQLFSKKNIAVFLLLIVTALAHGMNMFGFPAYREDEGTYISQAWAVLYEHKLATYTYWYDHAPVGWILMAFWNGLTGGFFTAGLAVNSGRIFMLFINLISTFLVFKITHKISKRLDAAILAALLFAVSPLAIIFHREVLLDNIMIFWFLLSMYYLTKEPRLINTIMSAAAYAIAVLTKESAIAFFPVLFLAALQQSYRTTRMFSIVLWTSVTFLAISIYPVFALLKGEFFPTGTILGGVDPHVSLIDAINFQANRSGGFFLEGNSSFMSALQKLWWRYGAGLIVAGSLISLLHLFMFRKKKWLFYLSLMSITYTAFIIRGQVLQWYILPLIPLFAIQIGGIVGYVFDLLPKKSFSALTLRIGLLSTIALLMSYSLWSLRYVFYLQQTINQVSAVQWVKNNIINNKILLTDNYSFVDFNPNITDVRKTNIQYYWKADTDPQVKEDVLHNDWQNIDYMLFTPVLPITIYQDSLFMVQKAYEKSHVVKRFNNNDILDEGFPVEVREVNNNHGSLRTSWAWYKKNFIDATGAVIDPSNGIITSEGQSYALLRSMWEGDKPAFDMVLSWTMNNLKNIDMNLFAWKAKKNLNGSVQVIDNTTAADADEDIALALLFAHKKWGDANHLALGTKIIQDLWNNEVIYLRNKYYLTAGANLDHSKGYLINPSYFSPASYKIFAEVDPAHDWSQLATDTYKIISDINNTQIFNNNETHLIPNWFLLDANGGYHHANTSVNIHANDYGYDAFRLYWRLALDYVWFNNSQAEGYLQRVSPFFREQLENKRLSTIYRLDGTPLTSYSDISTDVGLLSVLFVTNPELAIDVYSDKFWTKYADGHWGDGKMYYNQNWAWFATALYAYNLPNLWSTSTPQ